MSKKIAIVTGASSGIGAATANVLAQLGYDLILIARRKNKLEQLAISIQQQFANRILTLSLDVRNREEVMQTFVNLTNDWQNIHVLINNAGLASGLSTIDKGDLNDWDVMIDTNIKGLLYMSKAVIPFLMQNPFSHIVNIGSIAGKEVYMNGNVYCATKHAVDALSKSMRLELSSYPVKVTAIHPGAVETEFSIVRFHGDKEKAATVYKGFDNLVADDIADAIQYVISRPKHVTINDMVIMPTAQPNSSVIHRTS
ncbi:MAG: SDR family NAD(P)-dependent oxidoreductase [Bacteroidia bacterium]|nr:SDR family NAD(P)-dependent oxidoreductase [Bacteroidia bacterium]